LAWSELKIGILTIIAIVIASLTIFLVMGGTGFFWQRYSLKTRFTNVAGLKSGSPVRVAGVEKGSVTSVDLLGNVVDVTFQVNKDVQNVITTGSIAKLGSVSLLGESAVDITPSGNGTVIPEWGYVRPGPEAAQLSDLTQQAGEGIEDLTAIVHGVREGRGTIGRLLTDEQLYTELHRFVNTASDLAQGVRQGRGSVGRLLTDRQAADALESSLKNIERMTAEINAGQGSLGKLLKDESFSRSLSAATSNLEAVAAKLNDGQGTAGKLVTDPALFNKMNSISDRLDQLVARLNDGEGTVGQLLKDRQLYENMNKVTMELTSLFAEIKRDPKRYLAVKVSLF
jgi:phospholipid/cholesterol/gamma-HCH transport system substrate-binding protein